MSLKPSSRFTAKGTKKVQAQRKDGSTENDEIIIKQPWTLKREDDDPNINHCSLYRIQSFGYVLCLFM
jgi:hypothetical protein